MTDDTNSDETTDTDAETVREYWAAKDKVVPDGALGNVVASVIRANSEFEVTLTVGGSLISGVVVTRRVWLDAIREAYGQTAMEGFRELWLEIEDRIAADDSSEPMYDQMIHLRDAYWFGSGDRGLPTSETGMFWRGRLSEVQGWCVGRFSHSS